MKTNRIRHIVRLSQMLKRWRKKASLSSSKISGTGDDFVPSDVPPGHVAVCVGISGRRFIVRAKHLNHPAFQILLRKAEEEYGFDNYDGPLFIPCDESAFEDALKLATSHRVDDSSLSRCLVSESSPLLRGGSVARCRV